MRFAKVRRGANDVGVVRVDDQNRAFALDLASRAGVGSLADLLASPDPAALAIELTAPGTPAEALDTLALLPPVDRQEIWAAGVTYKRSKVAREEESVGAAQFYDKVYSAARPELFMKATPERTTGPGGPIRVRRDSKWSVPEPELTLVVSPDLRIVGYTVGNDVSSRDIEGENPLYLPQAKIYHGSCAVGPVVTLASAMPPLADVTIRLVIRRGGKVGFEGETSVSSLNRTVESLVEWLGRENHFPTGVLLMTGTGIVPPDEFTLSSGDVVDITISGIGTLSNPVA
ncbi:fumarylacetoacetate hydrolase family protein [Fimbriiglobus ruber]|uniref:Fumarylacetoacetate hydrolase family protein n=1 Tax=Fimbriiglobus ruber TaxID=1908690 RepID=A0A225DDQ3_9BACT|nr:fumarylacetoacetate hydrolase family protein [Fimbriiglobus ruber]OWK36648.1 Fumarylacetoacetate hydrolase family protein [Fimbriiglobus ruber]